jgi:putative ABC transport system substrate-binding protein
MSTTHRRYAGGQREARPLWYSPVGLLVVLALSLCAQPSGNIPRIGFLSGTTLTPELARGLEAFRHALRERGWVEGHNLAIEYRFAEGRFERLSTLAAELVGLHVDILVTEGSEGVQAAQHATQTIPIVMRNVGDPVQRGFIASLARPGGNVTGLAGASGDLNGKRLELLKEAMPTLTRVAVLWNPPQPAHAPMLKALEDGAQAVGVQLHPVAVHNLTDFEGAFSAMHAEALMIFGSDLHSSHVRRLADLALQSRLPAIAGAREFAESGGLMTYGPSAREALGRVAYYVDRLLKGTKPADLPVERPTKFELVLNRKTAQALGITFPPTLLILADEVLQ